MSARLTPGTRVIAVRDIGGWLRPRIPVGTFGIVTRVSYRRSEVVFEIPTWFSTKQVLVEVRDGECAFA